MIGKKISDEQRAHYAQRFWDLKNNVGLKAPAIAQRLGLPVTTLRLLVREQKRITENASMSPQP